MQRDFSSTNNAPEEEKKPEETKPQSINSLFQAGMSGAVEKWEEEHEKKYHAPENFVKIYTLTPEQMKMRKEIDETMAQLKEKFMFIESQSELLAAQIKDTTGCYDHHLHFKEDESGTVEIFKDVHDDDDNE